MRSARLDEAQDGIKTVGRNINNLRYADDTTLVAESEEKAVYLIHLPFSSVQFSHSIMSDSL